MARIFAALVLLVFLAFVYSALPKPSGTEVQIGEYLRDNPLHGLNTPDLNLLSYKGKPLIINMWASWCGPCREEMPSLQDLSRRYGDAFNVIGISTDDYQDNATAFLRSTDIRFNHYIDSGLVMEKMLGANRIPLTVLVDADGKIIDKINGARDWMSPASLELIGNAFHIPLQ